MRRAAGAVLVTVLALTAGSVPSRAEVRSQQQAPPVLRAAVTKGTAPTAAGIQRVLRPVLRNPALGGHVGAAVYDASRSRSVYATPGTFVPASTMKVLTTTGALAVLGPEHRFTTKVVAGKNASSLVLVGGGDPLLASRSPAKSGYPRPATLSGLAATTAKALKAKGVKRVSLGYDASLFSGPAANHRWETGYVPEGIAAPTTALWADEGRQRPGLAKRYPDPARAAATLFASGSKAAGITVSFAGRTTATTGAATVAQTRSPRLAAIVEHINQHSDNDAAEVLLRHVGLATKNGGSSAGGVKGLRATLTGLGLNLGKARIEDGSGLSRTNAVPLSLLGSALTAAAAPNQPKLRAVVTGLPVAAFNGSLSERFAGPGTAAGTGTSGPRPAPSAASIRWPESCGTAAARCSCSFWPPTGSPVTSHSPPGTRSTGPRASSPPAAAPPDPSPRGSGLALPAGPRAVRHRIRRHRSRTAAAGRSPRPWSWRRHPARTGRPGGRAGGRRRRVVHRYAGPGHRGPV